MLVLLVAQNQINDQQKLKETLETLFMWYTYMVLPLEKSKVITLMALKMCIHYSILFFHS